nr:hypothetical protein [uncultured Leptotrichia sp.]
MKKIIALIIILLVSVMSCTEADRQMMREVDQEMKERGVECLYNERGNPIGVCRYIK